LRGTLEEIGSLQPGRWRDHKADMTDFLANRATSLSARSRSSPRRRSRTAPFPNGFASERTTPSGTIISPECSISRDTHLRAQGRFVQRGGILYGNANVWTDKHDSAVTTLSEGTGARLVSASKCNATTQLASLLFSSSLPAP
jgi:hypothetical protein